MYLGARNGRVRAHALVCVYTCMCAGAATGGLPPPPLPQRSPFLSSFSAVFFIFLFILRRTKAS